MLNKNSSKELSNQRIISVSPKKLSHRIHRESNKLRKSKFSTKFSLGIGLPK